MFRHTLSRLLTILLVPAALIAQAPFSGFTSGNIVLTRSVYAGNATTITIGQPLPPVCPATAACGTVTATDNGAYASLTSTNNVFNNNKVDGSFGVTSPIFIDQLTPTGTLISTLAVPPNMLVTSFKLEVRAVDQSIPGPDRADAGRLRCSAERDRRVQCEYAGRVRSDQSGG